MSKIWVSFVLWKKAEVREGWVEKKKSYGMREREKKGILVDIGFGRQVNAIFSPKC